MEAELEACYKIVCKKFGIKNFTTYQKTAFKGIVCQHKDIFVNLPTGAGKSLIYQALPTIFDSLYGFEHLVVVVSPLLSLIADQVKKLQTLGITAVSLSDIKDEKQIRMVEEGAFSVVYGTPECFLKNERWRSMLSNEIFRKRTCAVAVDEAHVVKQWFVYYTLLNHNIKPIALFTI
jgi:superfamily II DNA helicase RecQ